MKKSNFQILSVKDLQSVNGGQEFPIIIHTHGMMTSLQIQQIESMYPSNTIFEIVY